MGIVQENYSGIYETSLEGFLLHKKKLFLTGEITSEKADLFVRQMLSLEELNFDESSVWIYINSPGGEISSGLTIIDIIHASNFFDRLHICCTGSAMSMAAVILACGKKGMRHMLPNSKTMIHQPILQGRINQNATSIEKMTQELLHTKDMINGMLGRFVGKPQQEIDRLTESGDYLMNAEQSIEFGIADSIISSWSAPT